MGLGDQLIATGIARGAVARGKRIAFGDGRTIVWDQHSAEIFRGNPNIAPPGSERDPDLEWSPYRKGNRLYNRHDKANDRWMWNLEWRCTPGEMFFSAKEVERGRRAGSGFVLIEPNVEGWKSVAPNKDWGRARYQGVATQLRRAGLRVCQFVYDGGGALLEGVQGIRTGSFRDALSVLANAALYIGPEGGLHHGAAAVGVRGVVIFGGFIPPQVTGYAMHTNLVGSDRFCGSLHACRHCRDALNAISVDQAVQAARKYL